jgi:hypothetical protein
VRFARNTSAQQYFHLDNLRTTDERLGGGPGGSAIPQPSTGTMVIHFGALLHGMQLSRSCTHAGTEGAAMRSEAAGALVCWGFALAGAQGAQTHSGITKAWIAA